MGSLRPGNPARTARVPDREARLADLRARGVRGGIIPAHRAMAGLAISRQTIVVAALLSLGTTAAVFAALNPLAERWAQAFEALAGPLGMSGGVGTRFASVAGRFAIQTPYLLGEAGPPDQTTWRVVAIITGAVLLLSLVLPQRLTPLRYFLRFAVVLQGISLGFFALAPAGAFPYTLPSYTGGLLAAGQVVLLLLPIILGFTYYLFDVSWARKIVLTALLLGHLAVLIPLQVLVHAWLIARGSLLLLPVLFLLFGILVQVMVFVAFYGWGMSWRPPARRE